MRGGTGFYSSQRAGLGADRKAPRRSRVGTVDKFQLQCETPRQIELANAFCRYLEMAQLV